MQKQSIVFGVAGVFFGLLVGWIIGSQQPGVRPGPPVAAAAPQASSAAQAQPPPPALAESRAAALKVAADRNPSDAVKAGQLGDLYFDAERYADAMQWYEAAMKIDPKNINASTDLGSPTTTEPAGSRARAVRSVVCDRRSTPRRRQSGIVRAFGRTTSGPQACRLSSVAPPESPEAAKARQGLDGCAPPIEAVGGKPVERAASRALAMAHHPVGGSVMVVMRALSRLARGVLEGAGYSRTPARSSVSLVRDPVCGVFVAPANALTSGSGQATKYFCSEKCRRDWTKG